MRIEDFVTQLAAYGTTRAVTVKDNTVQATRATALFGHRFRSEGARERHRQTIDAFISAVRTEHGETCASLTTQLLATRRSEGKPLRKYIISDVLRAVENERLRVHEYNDKITDLGALVDYMRLQPEAAGLPDGLIGMSARRTKDLINSQWKDPDNPITPAFLKQIATNCLIAYTKMITAEILVQQFESRTDEGQPLRNALEILQEKYALSNEVMNTVIPHVCTLLTLYAWLIPQTVTTETLVELVSSEKLPGLRSLFNLLTDDPQSVLDPLFAVCTVTPFQAAWIDATFPNAGIARTLAFQNAAKIFSFVPDGSPPMSSDIWHGLFGENDLLLNIFPEKVEQRIREHLTELLQNEADALLDAQDFDPDIAINLLALGLSRESAVRIACGNPLVSVQDYIISPVPFNNQTLQLLTTDLQNTIEQTLGNHFTTSEIFFTIDNTLIEVPIFGTQCIGKEHYSHFLPKDTNNAVLAAMALTEKLCPDTPKQRDAVLLLTSSLGKRPLCELAEAFGMPLNEQAGSTITVHTNGDCIVVNQNVHLLHPSRRTYISGNIEYRVTPDGTCTTPGAFFALTPERSPEALLANYIDNNIYSEGLTNIYQGGLQGTLEKIQTQWKIETKHLPVLELFIRTMLPLDFAQKPIPTSIRLIEEYILTLKLTGIAEMLHSLGALVPQSAYFSTSRTLTSYADVSATDKAWLTSLVKGGMQLVLGLQFLDDIKKAAPDAPPFTPQAFWTGIFKQQPPDDLTKDNLIFQVQDEIDARFREQLGDIPELIIFSNNQGSYRTILKDIFMVSGMKFEAAIQCAMLHSGVKTEDFSALPVLCALADIPQESTALSSLAKDVYRLGIGSDPVLVFEDPLLGTRQIYPQQRFRMSEEEWTDLQNAGLNNPVMRGIIQHTGNICGDNEIQHRALYVALGQIGLMPFCKLSRAASLEHVIDEHEGCTIAVVKEQDGSISVTCDTLKDNPIDGHIRWIIRTDGLGECKELTLHTRPLQEEESRQRIRFARSRAESIHSVGNRRVSLVGINEEDILRLTQSQPILISHSGDKLEDQFRFDVQADGTQETEAPLIPGLLAAPDAEPQQE